MLGNHFTMANIKREQLTETAVKVLCTRRSIRILHNNSYVKLGCRDNTNRKEQLQTSLKN